MKADGTWTDWQDMGVHARGVKFDHPTQFGGIFQLKAVIVGRHEDAILYLRKKNETKTGPDDVEVKYGDGKIGEPDAFGVVDDPVQVSILSNAVAALGDITYAATATVEAHGKFQEVGPDSHCNVFVSHKADDAGAIVPLFNGYLPPYDPPTANQWSGTEITVLTGLEGQEFNVSIPRWILHPQSEYPQPGFLIAHPSAKPHSSGFVRAAGHVGIIDYDGIPIAAGSKLVHKGKDHGLLDQSSRMRSYDPTHDPQFIEGWTPEDP